MYYYKRIFKNPTRRKKERKTLLYIKISSNLDNILVYFLLVLVFYAFHKIGCDHVYPFLRYKMNQH